jgi:hypothetical protein
MNAIAVDTPRPTPNTMPDICSTSCKKSENHPALALGSYVVPFPKVIPDCDAFAVRTFAKSIAAEGMQRFRSTVAKVQETDHKLCRTEE